MASRFTRPLAAACSGAAALAAQLVAPQAEPRVLQIPSGQATDEHAELIPANDVVGGHAGMLRDSSNLQILKPIRNRRGHAEAEFYRTAFDRRKKSGPPATFMPQYYGVSTLQAEEEQEDQPISTEPYIVLEDLTAGYRKPCILDVKMGVQTWDEDAAPAKVESERSKYPPQQKVGFRLTGMRVWNANERKYREHGRSFGYKLHEGTLTRAFEEFLWDGQRFRVEVAEQILTKLDDIEAWMAEQSSFRFYGSSLLIIYEGEDDTPSSPSGDWIPQSRYGVRQRDPSPARTPLRVDVRMIDFAHVWPITDGPQGRDEGYLLGLRSLKGYLRHCIAEAESDPAALAATTTLAQGQADGDNIRPLDPRDKIATAMLRIAAAAAVVPKLQ